MTVKDNNFRSEVEYAGDLQKMVVTDGAVAEFAVGEVITDDTDGTIFGTIVKVIGTNPNSTLIYTLDDVAKPFTVSTGTFASDGGGTGTAVNASDVGAVILVPNHVNSIALYGKVTGTPGSGDSIEITVSSADEVDQDTAVWFAPAAAFTDMTNTAYNLTQLKTFEHQAITGVRALRAVADSVDVLLMGVYDAAVH